MAVAVEADDWLKGLRGHVVAFAEDEVGRELAEMEGLGDALLVRASSVSSAHGLTLSEFVNSPISAFRSWARVRENQRAYRVIEDSSTPRVGSAVEEGL